MEDETGRAAAVIFDLDGTLLDTLADIGGAANRVLAELEFPQHPLDDYRHFVGEGVARLFERALPDGARDGRLVERCVSGFREEYARTWNEQTAPYEGVARLLAELAARGVPLAVLSNKPHAFTVACIEEYFGQTDFVRVLGQRDEVPRKPDPAGALEIAAAAGLPADRFLFVGDTPIDMATARAARMHAVGVTWGFRPRTELAEQGAATLIERPAELLALVDGRPDGR
jgi:phosphoglycolate phosphatase